MERGTRYLFTRFGAVQTTRFNSLRSAISRPSSSVRNRNPSLSACIKGAMHRKAKYIAQIDNVYFVGRLGASLREATADIVREELPENIRLLLRRLERLEAKGSTKKTD
jgi:hypothetical protein